MMARKVIHSSTNSDRATCASPCRQGLHDADHELQGQGSRAAWFAGERRALWYEWKSQSVVISIPSRFLRARQQVCVPSHSAHKQTSQVFRRRCAQSLLSVSQPILTTAQSTKNWLPADLKLPYDQTVTV